MYLQTLVQLIRANRWFYAYYGILFAAGLIIQASFTQAELTLAINGLHNPALDLFFRYFTNLGDGLFAGIVMLLVFIFLRSEGWRALLCWALPSLFTQLMKHQFFAGHHRPAILMKDEKALHYIEGVFMNELHSFPSGHSTTAFALFCYAALRTANKRSALVFLLVAVLTGLSRIYLLQHFFEDVLAGSFIGVSFATIIFAIFEYRKQRKATLPEEGSEAAQA